MASIDKLQAKKVLLKDGSYYFEYTFENGKRQDFFDSRDVLLSKTSYYELKDAKVSINESYEVGDAKNKSILKERVTVYINKFGQKSEVQAFFDENGYCTHIYNRTVEKGVKVEYHYDLRGYKDTEGKFFKYAPADKIINKGLPIEQRVIYQYKSDDTVVETIKNAVGDVISEKTHKLEG